jgi:3-oxoacyl-[acyl-carrier protein] reductase
MFGVVNTRARASYAKPEWVTAEEVGAFIAYLASDEARMINGGILQMGDRPPPTS